MNNNQQIEMKVNRLIAEHLAVSETEITSKSSFVKDLGADSLDAMDLLMAVNEEFNIHIPPEKMDDIHTVNDMVKVISHMQRSTK